MIEKEAVFAFEIPILAMTEESMPNAQQKLSYAKCLLLLLLLCLSLLYLKQTMFLGYIVLQLFCIYNLCYMQCYFTHEICFVLLHWYFLKYVCSVQYGCFL